MTTQVRGPRSNHDEVDIRDLFSGIGRLFKLTFLKFILFIVGLKNAVKRDIKLLFVILALGGAVGIVYSLISEDTYESSILLRSSYLSDKMMESSVEKLNILASENDYVQLAKTLDIDVELSEKIKGFRFEPFVAQDDILELEIFKEKLKSQVDDQSVINPLINKLKLNNKSTFRVFVETADFSIIPNLEQPVVDYFKNISYVSKRLNIEKKNLELRAANLDQELQTLDSLKAIAIANYKEVGDKQSGSNNVILADEKTADPIKIFNRIRSTYNSKLGIQKELFLNPHFELMESFTVSSTPANPGTILLAVIGIAFGTVLFLLIIAFKATMRYLDKVERSYNKSFG